MPKESKKSASGLPLNEALKEVIKNLKNERLLSFLLGAGILFLIAGSTVNNLQILQPLGGLFILGIVIWGFLETRKYQQGKITTGDVDVAKGAKAKHAEFETGGVSGSAGNGQTSTGGIKIGGMADLNDVKIKTGGVKIEGTGGSVRDEKKKD